MKTYKLKTAAILLAFVPLFMIACSSEETINQVQEDSKIQVQYENNKSITSIHNDMLTAFYNDAVSKGVKFESPVLWEDVDGFVTSFATSIKGNLAATKTVNNEEPDIAAIISITKTNDALFSTRRSTRSIENTEHDYLYKFCELFYAIEDSCLNKGNVDVYIKNILSEIDQTYPNMSAAQVENLAFVSSLTYNSYIYWYDHAIEWYENLNNNTEPTITRGVWSDLWGAVKSGTKKWAYADTKGAVSACAGSGIIGKAVAPVTALAGAAVGSTIGAVENMVN